MGYQFIAGRASAKTQMTVLYAAKLPANRTCGTAYLTEQCILESDEGCELLGTATLLVRMPAPTV